MRDYILAHIANGYYKNPTHHQFTEKYDNISGWTDYLITEHIVFSHRKNDYSRDNFIEKLDNHKYYEIDFYLSGDMWFFCEKDSVVIQEGLVAVVRPYAFHARKLMKSTVSERYVVYFSANAFSFLGANSLSSFAQDTDSPFLLLSSEEFGKVFSLLRNTENALRIDNADSSALALSYIIQLFAVLNRHTNSNTLTPKSFKIPENVLRIKEYIDQNFLEINTVSDIANHFFYSREYVSKIFSRHFSTSIYSYLIKKKVTHSIKLIDEGETVNNACFKSGFGNITSYIKAFKSTMGVTPSKYISSLK